MKKLLIALGILALAIPAYGRVLDLWVGDGTGTPDSYDQDTGDSYFEACMEIDGDLTNLVTQRFEWGFWAAANEYVVIAYDVAVGANWLLQIDDTTGAETIDSLVAATVDPTKLEIAVDAAGNVSWAINDVAMPAPPGTTLMTANPHYTWWELTDTAAAPHTVAVDYVQIEQLKMQ